MIINGKFKLILVLLFVSFYVITILIFIYNPFRVPDTEQYESSSEVEIVFLGDIMLARRIERKIEEMNS